MKFSQSLISGFDIVSFDVFDTLLIRPYLEPKDVWRRMGSEFFEARNVADIATYDAATKRGGEHTIDEAYELMGPKWSGWKKQELDAQRKCLVANPEMVEFWEKVGELGKKRVIISDMYVDEDWLKETLREKGIDGWDAFYVSSRVQKRKSTGELFAFAKKDLESRFRDGEHKLRFLHVGDNEWSDVKRAEENGFSAVKYTKIADMFFGEFPFVRKFYRMRPSFERNCIIGSLALGWHLYKCAHNNWSYWNKIGFLFGGTLGYSYVKWIVRRCVKQGFEHLMFVGRDGYVWQKIAVEIAPRINSDYFYAPRTIGVRVLGAAAINGHPGVDADRKRFAEECSDNAEQVRSEYSDYIAQFGIVREKTALVDGMSSQFSAQRLVESVLGGSLYTFYLMTYHKPDSGDGYIRSNNQTVKFQRFTEFIFSSPEAPVLGVSVNGPDYKIDVDPFERFRMSVCKLITDGAVDCAKTLNQFGVVVKQQDWIDMFDVFTETLSFEDKTEFEYARMSLDVNHRQYSRIVEDNPGEWRRWTPRFPRLRIGGRQVFKTRTVIRDGVERKSLWLFGKMPLFWWHRDLYSLSEY